jgi:DNA-binding transcriptional LysR family regulator
MKKSMPSWDLFAAFLAVMHHGSLSAAARALTLTQPTMRRQIAELETALDCTLFTRSKAGLLPTRAAMDLLPHAQTMASSAEALVRSASGNSNDTRGVVRISCSEMLGTEVLPSILAPIGRQYPGLEFEVSPTDKIEDVLRGDADLAIRMVRPTQAALVARRAGTIEVGLFASPQYLQERPLPSTPSGLTAGHRLIGNDRHPALLSALHSLGITLARRDFAYRVDSHLAQLAALRAGLGIGICQAPLARLATPPLVRVLPEIRFDMETWVVMHEDLKTVRRIRVVFDALAEGLAAYASGVMPALAEPD